jgi:hypothetical protein
LKKKIKRKTLIKKKSLRILDLLCKAIFFFIVFLLLSFSLINDVFHGWAGLSEEVDGYIGRRYAQPSVTFPKTSQRPLAPMNFSLIVSVGARRALSHVVSRRHGTNPDKKKFIDA